MKNVFEGMFGPKKKKAVEAKDLPPQPQPFFSHDPTDDPYYGGMPTSDEEANYRYLNSGTHDASQARNESDAQFGDVVKGDKLPTPSQGSVEQVGVRRGAIESTDYEDFRRNKIKPIDNSWKEHRDTPYRPEA